MNYSSVLLLTAVLTSALGHVGAAWASDANDEEPAEVRVLRQRHGRELSEKTLPSGARLRLGSLAFSQPEPIQELALAADGKTIITVAQGSGNAARLTTLRRFDTSTGRLLALTEAYEAGFSHDFRFLFRSDIVSEKSDDQPIPPWRLVVDVLDPATGKSIRRFDVMQRGDAIEAMADSPTGKLMAISAVSSQRNPLRRRVALFDVATGKEVRVLLEDPNDKEPISHLTFSRNGKVVGAFGGNRIHVWDAASAKELCRIEAPVEKGTRKGAGRVTEITSEVSHLSLSNDGTLLVYTESLSRNLHLCSVATGREMQKLPGGYTAAVFSPTDRYLAALAFVKNHNEWGRDQWGAVHVFEVATGEEVCRFGKEWLPATLAFSADSKSLWTGGHDGKVRRWELPICRQAEQSENHGCGVRAVAFSPDGKVLASVADGVRIWDAVSGKLVRRFGQDLHSGDEKRLPDLPRWAPPQARVGLTKAEFSADGKHLITFGWDRVVRLWETQSGTRIRQMEENWNIDHFFSFLDGFGPDATVIRSDAHKLYFHDPRTDRERYPSLPSSSATPAFTRDGRSVALVDESQREIRIWELATGKKRASLTMAGSYVATGASFPLNGPELIVSAIDAGTGEEHAAVWDIETGKETRRLRLSHTQFHASPDGRMVAFPDVVDNAIVLWDWQADREICRLTGHLQKVLCLAFSPDGKTLASGSSDGTVLLWDMTRLPKDHAAPK